VAGRERLRNAAVGGKKLVLDAGADEIVLLSD
jgi:hypothetical protein